MKTITWTEALANPNKYIKICKREEVLVTRKGVPAFKMCSPEDDNDTFIEDLIEHNPKFRKMLEERKHGKYVSAEEAMKWFE